jgi:hypothetical protein
MQCRYDVTLWSVRVAIVAVETQRCISCYFGHYLINGMVFGEKIIEKKCVLISYTILSKIFLIVKRIRRDGIINKHRPA